MVHWSFSHINSYGTSIVAQEPLPIQGSKHQCRETQCKQTTQGSKSKLIVVYGRTLVHQKSTQKISSRQENAFFREYFISKLIRGIH